MTHLKRRPLIKPTVPVTVVFTVLATALIAAPGLRPTDKIAADLGVPEQVFISCFLGVSPDKDHAPSGETQRKNKAVLLPCLQAENSAITNDMLDQVMDRYRPEGPMN